MIVFILEKNKIVDYDTSDIIVQNSKNQNTIFVGTEYAEEEQTIARITFERNDGSREETKDLAMNVAQMPHTFKDKQYPGFEFTINDQRITEQAGNLIMGVKIYRNAGTNDEIILSTVKFGLHVQPSVNEIESDPTIKSSQLIALETAIRNFAQPIRIIDITSDEYNNLNTIALLNKLKENEATSGVYLTSDNKTLFTYNTQQEEPRSIDSVYAFAFVISSDDAGYYTSITKDTTFTKVGDGIKSIGNMSELAGGYKTVVAALNAVFNSLNQKLDRVSYLEWKHRIENEYLSTPAITHNPTGNLLIGNENNIDYVEFIEDAKFSENALFEKEATFNGETIFKETPKVNVNGKNENVLTDFDKEELETKINDTASDLGGELEIEEDLENYRYTFKLKNGDTVLSSKTIDLPLESVVVGAEYDSANKEIVLHLRNDSDHSNDIRVPIADLVKGLATTSQLNTKVDKTTYNTKVSEIETEQAKKLNASEFKNKFIATPAELSESEIQNFRNALSIPSKQDLQINAIEMEATIDKAETTLNASSFAIEDSTMLVKKIAGQTKRASENLLNSSLIEYKESETLIGDYGKKTFILNKGTYTFSIFNASGSYSYQIYLGSSLLGTFNNENTKTFTITNNNTSVYIYFSKAMTNCKFSVVKGTTAPTEYKAYDNRLINAKANLVSKGRNLFSKENYTSGGLGTSGNVDSQYSDYFVSDYIKVEEGETYTRHGGLNSHTLALYDRNKKFVSNQYNGSNLTFTIPSGVRYIRLNDLKTNLNTLMIVRGTTAPTEYEAYVENTLEINTELGQFDYIDVENKKVIIKTAKVNLDSLSWTATSRNRWQCSAVANIIKKPLGSGSKFNGISNNYEIDTADNVYLNTSVNTIAVDTVGNLFVYNNSTTEQPSGELVYELATPNEEFLPIENGLFVWKNGTLEQSYDSENYLPYSIDIKLALNIASQVKLNALQDIRQQEQIEHLQVVDRQKQDEIDYLKSLKLLKITITQRTDVLPERATFNDENLTEFEIYALPKSDFYTEEGQNIFSRLIVLDGTIRTSGGYYNHVQFVGGDYGDYTFTAKKYGSIDTQAALSIGVNNYKVNIVIE